MRRTRTIGLLACAATVMLAAEAAVALPLGLDDVIADAEGTGQAEDGPADEEPEDGSVSEDSSAGEDSSEDAAEQPLVVAPFDPDGVVVQPGQPFHYGSDMIAGCTTAFLAGDAAFARRESDGRRYMITTGHCLPESPVYGGGEPGVRSFVPGTGAQLYLQPMNPSIPAIRQPDDLVPFATTRWLDATHFFTAVDGADFYLEGGVALLDDGVSVDPAIPGVGVPTGVSAEPSSLWSDGHEADVLRMYGRGVVLGDAAGTPTLPLRYGPVQSVPRDEFVCGLVPSVVYDSGSPAVDQTGAAVGVLSFGTTLSDAWVGGALDAPCDMSVFTSVAWVLDRFEQDTGVRLHLLTGRSGPIVRPDSGSGGQGAGQVLA